MNRAGHEEVNYFIGPEVEKTPAADKRTLFVVGMQDVDQIERMAREHRTPHIFMGANHSFINGISDSGEYWDLTITALLDKGFWVTLDYEAHLHEIVLKMLNPGIWQSRLFIPLLSVRIPHLQKSSINLTIKFDDIDFEATNEGVWCLHHHQVTDSNRFTPWQDYATDSILEPMAGAVPNPVLTIPVPKEPVYADINKPAVNLAAIKAQMQDTQSAFMGSLTAIQNDASLGLDTESLSKLKPDADADETLKTLDVIDAASAAEAYAEGAKEDPLGPKGAAKPAKNKK